MRAAQLLYSASHNRSGHAGMIGFKTPCDFGGRRGQLKERGISLVLRDESDQIGQADLVTRRRALSAKLRRSSSSMRQLLKAESRRAATCGFFELRAKTTSTSNSY